VADYTLPSGGNPYGFAVDSKGVLWISSPTGGASFYGIDTKTGAVKHTVARSGESYGVTLDGNDNVWMAGWCSNYLHRIDAVSKVRTSVSIGLDSSWCARGMAVDTDGNIWAATARWNSNACGNASYVQKFEKGTGKLLGNYTIGGDFGGGGLGISQDGNGKIWVTSTCTHKAARINKDTGATELVASLYGTNPYTYSDWTGAMLKNVTTKNGQMGVWTANFDGTSATTTWQQATFDAIKPTGTNVRVRFRASATIETIEAAPWCVPASSASPVDLKACNFGQKRWLQAEVYLITANVDVQPKVDNFKVYWQK
jgi:streptogramin lyase